MSPPSGLLGPWGRSVLQISCFNDMCGDYHDTLHIKVGVGRGCTAQRWQQLWSAWRRVVFANWAKSRSPFLPGS